MKKSTLILIALLAMLANAQETPEKGLCYKDKKFFLHKTGNAVGINQNGKRTTGYWNFDTERGEWNDDTFALTGDITITLKDSLREEDMRYGKFRAIGEERRKLAIIYLYIEGEEYSKCK